MTFPKDGINYEKLPPVPVIMTKELLMVPSTRLGKPSIAAVPEGVKSDILLRTS